MQGPRVRGDGHHSRRGSRSSSNSSDSAKSGSGHSPNRGSPVPGYRKSWRIDSSEAMGVKKESQTQFYKVDEREFAKFRFFKGLQELFIARTKREMLVAVAGRHIPGLMTDRAFLLDFGVSKDSVEKVMQIYRSYYGNIQARDKGRGDLDHQNNRLEIRGKSRHMSSRRDSSLKDQGEDRHSGGEKVNRNLRRQLSSQEQSQGYRGRKKTDMDDLPVLLEFRKYEDSPRTERFHDRERARDKRDSYHVHAVAGGLETAIAELTKQVGGLTQEVRGMKTRLDSIDSRLAKVEAWEGMFIKIEDRLDSVDKQLWERAESPVRWRPPSPGSRGFACGGEGHCRSECPRPPTLTFEDQIQCLVCGERGHSNASCSRSGSRSSSPKGQGN